MPNLNDIFYGPKKPKAPLGAQVQNSSAPAEPVSMKKKAPATKKKDANNDKTE